MATERRQKFLLGLLVVVLVGAAIYELWPATSAAPPAASNRQAVATRGTGRAEQGAAAQGAPDVHLDALEAEKPKPAGTDRNLFRYKPKAPPPPPPTPPRAADPVVSAPPVAPTGPPQPAPPPPIPLKFIGIMGPENSKIAVLSDSKGPPISAKEGELVLGQYRVLKIGVESVEVAYADGRGRVTLRLSGQP